MRQDGRDYLEPRPIHIVPDFLKHGDGSVLIEVGDTKVICTATIDNKVPPFLKGAGRGWVTAEYGMLPRSTYERTIRETFRPSGRTQEIQRFIGRALRASLVLESIGEYTIIIDCDVIQADGGTRTASITGGYVTLVSAIFKMRQQGIISMGQGPGFLPIKEPVAGISVGILKGKRLVDLNNIEDNRAEVDLNLVMTSSGKLVEVQGTGEESTFTVEDLNELIKIGFNGLKRHFKAQEEAIKYLGI